jgi:hypothetical protein
LKASYNAHRGLRCAISIDSRTIFIFDADYADFADSR